MQLPNILLNTIRKKRYNGHFGKNGEAKKIYQKRATCFCK